MKTIGLIGGMSWESTALYYQVINREVRRRRGGLRSAAMRIASVDFEDVAARQRTGDWDGLADMLGGAARGLVDAGAECVLIGTNTMHRVAPQVAAAARVPLLHIVDATARAVHAAGCTAVGLLGTRFTMEQPFYVEHLARLGIACVVPPAAERDEVHRIIFDELCRGEVRPVSRAALREIAAGLQARGAAGIVLGCTELPLILEAADSPLPLFDTTTLHALAAVEFALG